MLEAPQVGQAISLHPEAMAHHTLRENPVDMLEDGDQPLGTKQPAPTHRSYPDHGPRRHRYGQRVQASFKIRGESSLDHGHEAVGDPEVGGTHAAIAVGADRP